MNIDQDSVRPDRKFEGSHLNLQNSDKKSMSAVKKSSDQPVNKLTAQKEYIDTLQKQIANMETQIGLLKGREVDQKNKASGYETLLRDGIPLNEHFLILKNKYKKEKGECDKSIAELDADCHKIRAKNNTMVKQIEQKKKEQKEFIENFLRLRDKHEVDYQK